MWGWRRKEALWGLQNWCRFGARPAQAAGAAKQPAAAPECPASWHVAVAPGLGPRQIGRRLVVGCRGALNARGADVREEAQSGSRSGTPGPSWSQPPPAVGRDPPCRRCRGPSRSCGLPGAQAATPHSACSSTRCGPEQFRAAGGWWRAERLCPRRWACCAAANARGARQERVGGCWYTKLPCLATASL